MSHLPPGITDADCSCIDPYIGELNDLWVEPVTVAQDITATEDMKAGTLLVEGVGGTVSPFTGTAVTSADRVMVLWQPVTAAALVAGDVESFAHLRGAFRRSGVIGYDPGQESGLNLRGIYTKDVP